MYVRLFVATALTFGAFAKAADSAPRVIRFGNPSCKAAVEGVSEALSPEWMTKQLNNIRKNLTPAQMEIDAKIHKDGLLEMDQEIIKWHQRPFTKVVTSIGKVTNQKQSGDCWINAATNEYKSELISAGLVKENFQFSRNFFYFVSSLEKTNTYLQDVINLKPTSLNSEIFSGPLKLSDTEPEFRISDGGEFSWMLFLVSKYGLVPEQAMPDNKVSLNTDSFIRVWKKMVIAVSATITDKINSYGPITELTTAQKQELDAIKKRGIRKILKYMARTLGFPPDLDNPFKFQVNGGKPDETPIYKEFDPLSFAREFVKFDPTRYVSLSNTPLQPYNKAYAIEENGAIGITNPGELKYNEHFVNVRSYRMLQLVKKMIDANKAVYFAADVTKDVDRKSGTMDLKLYKNNLDIQSRTVSRRAAVNSGLYSPDHAMAFIGYETDDQGNIIRLKVRNSWGTKYGDEGDFSMSLDWFKRYVFEVAIDKSLISQNERNLWENPHPTPITSFEKYYGPN